MLRTHTCGELRLPDKNKKVTLCGWVDAVRAFGKVSFIDIRDRYGKTQIVSLEKINLKVESCIQVTGTVVERKNKNAKIPTGDIELNAEKIKILSVAEPLPFDLNNENVVEDLRLKYRYLDLRREKMKRNIEMRHKIVQFIREFLDKEKFLEITTPLLTKSTPEGARDFIVPSRIHPGNFYALPQSPQQYKQLLMVAGIDKYFQIAPCLRDEDARADRAPGEFYQLDLEMSFIQQKDILDLIENLMIQIVKKLLPEKHFTQIPFPRLSYADVMKKYQSDKPDMRKNKNDANELAFCWVVDFPLFEEEKEKNHYAPKHHMFTMPKEEDMQFLNQKDAHKVKSYQHDLVLNGFEVGGGSVRIHDAEIQKKIFDLIGFNEKDKEYFQHMLTAFSYGVPPHGGIAPGIDRLIMVLLGEQNLREVIAFPKNQLAQDVLMGAPSWVKPEQLQEAHIKLDLPSEKKKENSSSELSRTNKKKK